MKGRAMPKAVYVPFIKRNHYFYGKVLAEKDLSDEQHYFREKQRLLNLHVFGGAVSRACTCRQAIAISRWHLAWRSTPTDARLC